MLKAGGIAVTTMPMLRALELSVIARKAQIDHVICEQRLCRGSGARGQGDRTLLRQ